jgi:CO/xanthine dehydrogenase FAD-binding subunit
MATLATVTEDETCRSLANGILAQTAGRDAAVNVRNAATVGGTMVVAPVDSEFILALLALAAELDTRSALSERTTTQSLDRFLADPAAALDGGLVTEVRLHVPRCATGGLAHVGRTPSDRPIVAAAAVVTGDPAAARIALGGVALLPLLVELAPAMPGASSLLGQEAAVTQAIATAEPYADFRGTVEYRRAMGELMAARALEQAVAHYERVWEVQ